MCWICDHRAWSQTLLTLFRFSLGIVLIGLAEHGSTHAMLSDHTQWSEPHFRGAYRLIASAEEWTILDTLSRPNMARYLKGFWKRRDPTPTTEPNEFKEQFEARVEIACNRYRAVPPPPWDARGDLYIKMGRPDRNRSYDPFAAGSQGFSSRVLTKYESSGAGGMGVRRLNFNPITGVMTGAGEIWSYIGYLNGQDLKVYFQKDGMTMEMSPSDTEDNNFLDTSHVGYQQPFGVKQVDMALDWFPFRRQDGDYDVYIACTMPVKELARRSGRKQGDLNYTGRVMAFDSTLQTAWTDSVKVNLHLDRLNSSMLAQNQWQVVLPAGFYMLAAEVEDPVGKKHSAGSFNRWLVPFADTVSLDLSPLIVAADIRPADHSSTGFVRNGKEIIPMTGQVFRPGQNVAFYHEVYELSPDSSGICYYQVEYSLYDRKHKNQRILYENQFSSTERGTFQSGSIPHPELKRGAYIMEAKVVDLNSGDTRIAVAQFEVK